MILNEKIFKTPQFIDRDSAWVEHIPFAFYLTSLIKPRVFVELGTHFGVSYFAFCQAIKDDSINCKAYAVDHWKGDEHAGFYERNVYDYVSEINHLHFEDFSTLLKMSFDEASKGIENNSIDLLHIDGMHTYEAVNHDFQTWLPKMSSSGVVLFHDTQVKKDDFAVWKLFSELKNQYPSFEFMHGCGLGILCVGSHCNDQLLKFIDSAKEEPLIPKLFASTGRKHSLEYHNKYLKKYLSKKEHGFAQLFYKNEEDNYSEYESFSQLVDNENMEFIFSFDDPEFVNGIRFDPLNNYTKINLKSIELFSNNSKVDQEYSFSSNAFRVDGSDYLFVTDDPQIHLNFTSKEPVKIDEVRIKVDYVHKGSDIIDFLTREIEKKTVLKNILQKVKTGFLKNK